MSSPRLLILSLSCLLVSLAGSAAPTTDAFAGARLDQAAVLQAAAEVTPERYPNADDVMVDDLVRVTYEPNGTSRVTDDEYVKILTEKGKRGGRQRALHYTLPYGTSRFVTAEIIKPDGTVITIDTETQSRTVVNRSQMGSNIYNPNSKIVQLSLSGLEVGDVVHVMTERNTVKARVPDTWSDYSIFEYTSPIKHIVYEVDAPSERPLTKIEMKAPVGDTVEYTTIPGDGRILHRWAVTDVPRMYGEPSMPALHTVVQRLLVSTIPDWESISRWYWELSAPHLDADTPEMHAKTAELVKDVTDRDEKIRRLFRFVSQEIRYMGITTETEAPGYEPHDVSTTFGNRYGVCRDKAALLVAMLRAAEVRAYPVLIHAGAKKDEEVPQPYFNHAIVAVERPGGGYELMDPTDENTRELLPSYLCNKSYLVAHPKGETLLTSPVYPAEENMLRIKTTGQLADNGTLITHTRLEFEGINDNAYRGYFAQLKPDERRRFFEGAVKQRMAGAELTRLTILPEDMQDTTQPLTVEFSTQARDYPVAGKGCTVLGLPWLGTSIGYVNFVLGKTGLPQRKYPLESEITCGVDETLEIALPTDTGAPLALPTPTTFKEEGIVFDQATTVSNSILTGTSRFLLTAPEFSPEQYLTLKQRLKDMEYARRKRPIFPPAVEPHDLQVLASETTIRLNDAGAWETTQHVRKRILTYAGKKKHSELKLNYNPVWQTSELVAATVSNINGKVHQIVDEELNLMDAGWAGGAPRYPAAKTLVVSLPGVELGSVIDYTIRSTQTNTPFFSMRASLQQFAPVDLASLTLDIPAALKPALDLPRDGRIEHMHIVQNGRRILNWSARDLPALKTEDALPPRWRLSPTIFCSTGDWTTYMQSIAAGIDSALASSSQAAARARELTEGLASPRARIEAIRDDVARRIRPAGPAFTELPLDTFTAADTVLTDGYGHSLDRAILLTAMLRAAGLPAEPVLVSDSGPVHPELLAQSIDIPHRHLYTSVLVETKLDGARIYLNDTDQYAELGACAHVDLPARRMDGTAFTITAAENFDNIVTQDYALIVEADGTVTMGATNAYYGASCGGFRRRFEELPPEERRRYFHELVAGVSQSAEAQGTLKTDTETYPGVRGFQVRAPRYGVRDGDSLHFLLPGSAGNLLGLRADTRHNPLYRPRRTELRSHVRVILPPETAAVLQSPESFTWDAPEGGGRVVFEAKEERLADGRTALLFSWQATLQSAVTSADLYPALLEANRRFQHPSMRSVVLRMK